MFYELAIIFHSGFATRRMAMRKSPVNFGTWMSLEWSQSRALREGRVHQILWPTALFLWQFYYCLTFQVLGSLCLLCAARVDAIFINGNWHASFMSIYLAGIRRNMPFSVASFVFIGWKNTLIKYAECIELSFNLKFSLWTLQKVVYIIENILILRSLKVNIMSKVG